MSQQGEQHEASEPAGGGQLEPVGANFPKLFELALNRWSPFRTTKDGKGLREAFGNRVGVSKTTIGNWISGAWPPRSAEILKKMLTVLAEAERNHPDLKELARACMLAQRVPSVDVDSAMAEFHLDDYVRSNVSPPSAVLPESPRPAPAPQDEAKRTLFVDCIVDYDPADPNLRVTLHYASELERLDAIDALPALLVRLHLKQVDLRLDLRSLAYEKGSVHSSALASFGRGWTVALPRQPNGPVLNHLDLLRLLPQGRARTIEILVHALAVDLDPEIVRPEQEGLNIKDARVIERVLKKWGCSPDDPELELDRIPKPLPGRGA